MRYFDMVRRSIFVALLFILPTVTGCAWQRIPIAPKYEAPASLPLRVGVELSADPASTTYGPLVIQRLKDWRVFDEIVFPYRKGDAVDAVMQMTVKGQWTPNTGANFAKGFIIGLSMYTLSPVLGVSMTGTHDINSLLLQKDAEIAKYSVHAKTSLEWGLAANTGEVGQKADFLQTSKLANDLATKVREDWPRIGTYFSRSGTSTTPDAQTVTEAPTNSPAQVVGSDLSEKAEKLRQLKKLKDEGILTEDEYEKKRKSVVDGL